MEVPPPLPLLSRSVVATEPIQPQNVFGDVVPAQHHTESELVDIHWENVAAAEEWDGNMGVTNVADPRRPSTKLPLTVPGGEPVHDVDLTMKLIDFFESVEARPCPTCGVADVPRASDGDDDDSSDDEMCTLGGLGTATWPGQTRYMVFGNVYGGESANALTCTPEHLRGVAAVVGGLATVPPIVAPTPSPPRNLDVAGTDRATASVYPDHVLTALEDTLHFSCDFESGNLRRAERVFDRLCPHREAEAKAAALPLDVHQEYDLWLREDINTKGNIQWFYFNVENASAGLTVRFNLVNHNKSDSLFAHGLKPLVYSDMMSRTRGKGWHRAGTNSCYFQGSHTYRKKRKQANYYVASFTYTFPLSGDRVSIAYCQPYTYTMLQQFLRGIESDPRVTPFFRRKELCRTLAGNVVDVITISAVTTDPEELQHRRGIIISARVHPGETNASWMMQGVLRFLTGFSPQARLLRHNFVFKVVPMLNPDGVIAGNYRCSLAGVDLNRRWKSPKPDLHPTIVAMKAMMRRIVSERLVHLFCDLHGHSRQYNIFLYGCAPPRATDPGAAMRARVIPHLLYKESPAAAGAIIPRSKPQPAWNAGSGASPSPTPPKVTAEAVVDAAQPDGRFSFADCTFNIAPSKKSTGRVVSFTEFNIANAFTLEASFCGAGDNAVIGRRWKQIKAWRKARKRNPALRLADVAADSGSQPPKPPASDRPRLPRPMGPRSGSGDTKSSAAAGSSEDDGGGYASDSEPDAPLRAGSGSTSVRSATPPPEATPIVNDDVLDPASDDPEEAGGDDDVSTFLRTADEVQKAEVISHQHLAGGIRPRVPRSTSSEAPPHVQRHFSSIDLELQGRAVPLCMVRFCTVPLPPEVMSPSASSSRGTPATPPASDTGSPPTLLPGGTSSPPPPGASTTPSLLTASGMMDDVDDPLEELLSLADMLPPSGDDSVVGSDSDPSADNLSEGAKARRSTFKTLVKGKTKKRTKQGKSTKKPSSRKPSGGGRSAGKLRTLATPVVMPPRPAPKRVFGFGSSQARKSTIDEVKEAAAAAAAVSDMVKANVRRRASRRKAGSPASPLPSPVVDSEPEMGARPRHRTRRRDLASIPMEFAVEQRRVPLQPALPGRSPRRPSSELLAELEPAVAHSRATSPSRLAEVWVGRELEAAPVQRRTASPGRRSVMLDRSTIRPLRDTGRSPRRLHALTAATMATSASTPELSAGARSPEPRSRPCVLASSPPRAELKPHLVASMPP